MAKTKTDDAPASGYYARRDFLFRGVTYMRGTLFPADAAKAGKIADLVSRGCLAPGNVPENLAREASSRKAQIDAHGGRVSARADGSGIVVEPNEPVEVIAGSAILPDAKDIGPADESIETREVDIHEPPGTYEEPPPDRAGDREAREERDARELKSKHGRKGSGPKDPPPSA